MVVPPSGRFERLVSLATEVLSKPGFSPLDEGGGERHGAWEWTWIASKQDRGHYYVMLLGSEVAPGAYWMEVWAGADDGVHFGRYPTRTLGVIQEGAADESGIVDALLEGALEARELPAASLNQYYVTSFKN